MLVFISHATGDDEFVDNLRAELHRHGYETWVDHHDKPPGRLWDEVVDEKLAESQLLILVWSPAALSSKNVGVEWREFHEQKKPIYALKVREAPLPLLLRHLNYMDFTDPAQFERQLNTLLAALPKPIRFIVPTNQLNTRELEANERELAELRQKGDAVLKESHVQVKSDELLLVFPNLPPKMLVVKLDREKLFIGRGLKADIDLNNYGAEESGVSRQHALLTNTASGLSLMDLNSQNGTFIERRRLAPQIPIPLNNDSLIRLGNLVIRVYFNRTVM